MAVKKKTVANVAVKPKSPKKPTINELQGRISQLEKESLDFWNQYCDEHASFHRVFRIGKRIFGFKVIK